jgi:serine/threonine-protein kinase
MTLAGQVFSNRYEIERELARGGMAEVYLARDQLLNRPVALKVLFPEFAREPSFVERFRREAQAAANLNHPNIVAIYDWGQESGTYFIVMEYVEGRALRDLIRSEGSLDANRTAEITSEIAAALAFAHRSGVVHRDVKPGNVLLTGSGAVKVTDFGIARAGTSDGLTQTGSVMGTATYFSPEQAQGLPVDGRSDVYSLGVVCYEMATGVAPFAGDSPVAVAYKHVREAPVPPSQRNPEVPNDLEQIILTAMAKDPDHRYQTADDLRADLLRFRRGRPLAAAPVTAVVTEIPTSATAAAAADAYAAATIATPRVDDRGRYVGGTAYQRPRRNPALVTTLTLLGLAALVAVILVVAIKLGGSEAKVTVPNEVDKTSAAAEADLRSKHLVPDSRPVSDARPSGTVVRQSPVEGTRVRRGGIVTLFVSKGAAQKKIPVDIKGQTFDIAQAELTAPGLGFSVVQSPQPSDTVEKGRVIDSKPPVGSLADAGSLVTLLVSSGPEQVTVPRVDNLTKDAAEAQLKAAGFTIFAALQEANDTIPKDLVTRTEPAAGKKAAKNALIRIFVSTGKSTITMPQERGKTLADAQTELEGLGFTVTTVERVSLPGNAGKVIGQDPVAGTEVEPNATVVLTIGVVPAVTTTTPTTGP